jgi:hypothetical protein
MRNFWILKITLILTFYTLNSFGELGPVYGKKGVWYKAHLTWYQSYPEGGSEECLKYNGCEYAGIFSYISTQQSEEWVQENNIIAVHSEHGKWLMLDELSLRVDTTNAENEIIGKVYDICADSDCGGCCTRNASEFGYLIDLEINTLRRLGYNKDTYPDFIYFKIYETEKQRTRREEREKRKEIRREERKKRKEERKKSN